MQRSKAYHKMNDIEILRLNMKDDIHQIEQNLQRAYTSVFFQKKLKRTWKGFTSRASQSEFCSRSFALPKLLFLELVISLFFFFTNRTKTTSLVGSGSYHLLIIKNSVIILFYPLFFNFPSFYYEMFLYNSPTTMLYFPIKEWFLF